MRKPSQGKKSNFSDEFLHDFGLVFSNQSTYIATRANLTYVWEYNKKALDRFHLPITFRNPHGAESSKHYSFKQKVHDYIYEEYYMSDGCKFYVTTELEQVRNPFTSYLDGARKIHYTLDVCAIRVSDNQVFDFEIDTGREHYTPTGMMKSEIRDKLLNSRYGIFTMRIDPTEYSDICRKDIDKFLSQPACKNPYYDIHNRKFIDNTGSRKRGRKKNVT